MIGHRARGRVAPLVCALAVLLSGLVALPVSGQVRSPANPDTGTSLFDVGGVKVIHRPSPGEIVVANLYLLGGTRNVSWENAGIELLLLETSERGTRNYTRDQLRRAMTRLGTTISAAAERDWTKFGIRATRTTFDSTWAILASRLMEPTLDPRDLDLVRQQFILGVSQRQDSPDALLEYLADSVAFAGHAYAIPPAGTERSLRNLTADALRRFHAEQIVRSRMLLVVVGSATRAQLERLIFQTLAKLPVGTYTWSLPDSLPRRRASAFGVERDLPTNYILGRFPGPKAGTQDYYALRVASAVLGGQLFAEIRSRRNLTYAVEAPFTDRAVSGGGFYVTTGSPQLTIDIMRQQLAAVRTSAVEPTALTRLVQQFLTQYFLDNESNSDQADALAQSYLFEGDYRAAANFERNLRSVSPADIQRVSQRWIRDVQWTYVGDTSKLPRGSMERF